MIRTELALRLPNSPGALAGVCRLLSDERVNIVAMSIDPAGQRYLYEQYQIPLHKMNVISYGEDKPIAPNKTKAGRAQNRRVVIKVLA